MNAFKVCFMAIALAGVAVARPQVGGQSFDLLDEDVPFNDNPQYSYRYQVADDTEQTYMAHDEARDGENVTGSYSYVDANGSLVTVTYQAGAMGYTEERDVQENFLVIRAKPARASQASVTSTSSSANSGFSSTSGFGNRGSSRQTTTTTSSSSGSNNGGGLVSQIVSQVRPAVQQVVSTETTSSSSGDGDLVARILAQLTPFIQQTVSSSLGGASQQQTTRTTTRRVAAQPQQVATRVVTRPVAQPQQVTRTVVSSAPVASSVSSSVEGIFGVQGANNVQFETPEFNYEFDL